MSNEKITREFKLLNRYGMHVRPAGLFAKCASRFDADVDVEKDGNVVSGNRITTGAMQGHLQLNVFMPLIGRNLLQSSRLLADVINSFNDHCLKGIKPNLERISMHLHNSLMLVTKLNPHIGYYNAAKIAQHAHEHGLTLRESALELGLVSAEDFDNWMKL